MFGRHSVKIGLGLLCLLLFTGLKFRDSHAPLPVHDRNRKEISRIKVSDLSEFTFAVFGDNKGNTSIFLPLLRDIDSREEIDFLVDLGDLVDGGSKEHYRCFLDQVQGNPTSPLLTVIGNHDLGKGGSANYREIFGPTFYSFQIGENDFIVLDAVSESGFDRTERIWLEDELRKAQAFKTRFVFMHVPPFDPRGGAFNKCLPEVDRKDLLDLFRRYDVTHLFASHIHGYFSGAWEGIPYTITGGAGGSLQGSDPQHFFHHYVEVHVKNGRANTIVRRIDKESYMVCFYNRLKDDAAKWAFLLGGCLFLSFGLSGWIKNSPGSPANPGHEDPSRSSDPPPGLLHPHKGESHPFKSDCIQSVCI
jgi:serine/threonine-protein phosphatase CPPED1